MAIAFVNNDLTLNFETLKALPCLRRLFFFFYPTVPCLIPGKFRVIRGIKCGTTEERRFFYYCPPVSCFHSSITDVICSKLQASSNNSILKILNFTGNIKKHARAREREREKVRRNSLNAL
jgi:hypothetical protein